MISMYMLGNLISRIYVLISAWSKDNIFKSLLRFFILMLKKIIKRKKHVLYFNCYSLVFHENFFSSFSFIRNIAAFGVDYVNWKLKQTFFKVSLYYSSFSFCTFENYGGIWYFRRLLVYKVYPILHYFIS